MGGLCLGLSSDCCGLPCLGLGWTVAVAVDRCTAGKGLRTPSDFGSVARSSRSGWHLLVMCSSVLVGADSFGSHSSGPVVVVVGAVVVVGGSTDGLGCCWGTLPACFLSGCCSCL